MRRFTTCVGAIQLVVLCALVSGSLGAQSRRNTVVIIPTIGNDHQVNLDYSVAHLAALLDVVRPDAIIVDDATSWLARSCPLNTAQPEIHVALGYSREFRIPIHGLRDWPPPGVPDPYAASLRASQAESAQSRDTAAAHAMWRGQLDRRSAQIARQYSYPSGATGLEQLVARGFADREAALTPQQRTDYLTRATALADSVMRLVSTSPARRWAVVVNWTIARPLTQALRTRPGVTVRPVESFLPVSAAKLERRMNRANISWILAGNLDEFYGMWAPQVFPRERLAALLRRLERIAPGDPVTDYMRARWLMQNRDYAAADTIMSRLAALQPDVNFPFPINGKWIRPPWPSVRRKAQLNQAFVLDYRGRRQEALAIYNELTALGPELDADARFFGYLYDDIQAAIRSYVDRPYTGDPSEAFRHWMGTVRRPECEPGR
ncbi:MAG: hypothetical protein ACR2L6_11815 [Gemmatimonadaceae bacterium]